MATWPICPVTVVGSWPRPRWLLEAMKRRSPELRALQDEAVLLAIRHQEDAGVDIISDGEQRRDNFHSFVTEKLEGMRLMSLADLFEHVDDQAAFEALLGALVVPAHSIKNPTAVGKLRRREPLVLDDYRFLRANTRKPVKVTLPGPYLLSRSSWVRDLSGSAYPTRESLAGDVVSILREEALQLADAGADVIQFDEPVLADLVFAGRPAMKTFLCSASANGASPEEEFDFAVDLINRVVEGIDGPIIALHICRGNWSRNEDNLLAGSYDSLIPLLGRIRVRQFVLEYATPRAGSLQSLRALPDGAQLGLGAVNPRIAGIESPEAVAARAREAAEILGLERIWLNPDCGFGTFSERPVATAEVASRKLEALARAAALLRSSGSFKS